MDYANGLDPGVIASI